jgi:hypothetical protein
MSGLNERIKYNNIGSTPSSMKAVPKRLAFQSGRKYAHTLIFSICVIAKIKTFYNQKI